jgi:hypothetical protein
MSNTTTKSVAVLTEEVRLLAASKLAAIVEACATEACSSKVSVPHAKFVLEIAQLDAAAAEKKSKPAAEKLEPEDEDVSREKCMTEVLIDMVNSLRIDPVK